MPDKDDKLIWESMIDPGAAHGSEEKGIAIQLINMYDKMMDDPNVKLDRDDIRNLMIDSWETIFREKGDDFADMVLNHIENSGYDRLPDQANFFRTALGNV